jgi:ribose-phosphate pyrophosphokinase
VSRPLLIVVPGSEHLGPALATALGADLADTQLRQFPDGEVYVRIDSRVAGRQVVVLGGLHQPSARFVQVAMTCATARDLGAARVGLVAPYLGFMRQDARFQPGEGVTSVYFARLLSSVIDWLVTVDPHLHRRTALAEIYSAPAVVASAAPAIAAWLRAHAPDAVLVGPDAESAQWVQPVAELAGLPHLVLEKVRRGDRDVSISAPVLGPWAGRLPVVLDDIASTARTMIGAVAQLHAAGAPPPLCLAIHPVFVDGAEAELRAAGVRDVVSCDTIAHATNQISVGDAVATAVRHALRAAAAVSAPSGT